MLLMGRAKIQTIGDSQTETPSMYRYSDGTLREKCPVRMCVPRPSVTKKRFSMNGVASKTY